MEHARHPLQDGRSPAWAVAWGEDSYGVFAAFALGPPDKPVEQRMRWISPGTFLMGSPQTELGRFNDEGPQHEVTLSRGYWLGETPVTQALWVAVMGENPSGFRGERADDLERPVERVSWDDCQRFLDLLNAQVAGLGARLPTEAEWERACRAGTTTATWIGDLSGEVDAPELGSIAWYNGNSGGETHAVGRKAPNPYGLHDMLGNVWEWCADTMRRYTAGHVTDPVGDSQGPSRVYRGGRGTPARGACARRPATRTRATPATAASASGWLEVRSLRSGEQASRRAAERQVGLGEAGLDPVLDCRCRGEFVGVKGEKNEVILGC